MAVSPDIQNGVETDFTYWFRKLVDDATEASVTVRGTDWTTLGTLVVPANKVGYIILVLADCKTIFSKDVNGTGTGEIRISIGESGSEAVKKTVGCFGVAPNSQYGTSTTVRGTIFHYYAPTADEKSNGFNVLIEGRTVAGGTGAMSGAAYYYEGVVLGC